MDDRQSYCEQREEELLVLEGQIGGVREKMAQASAEGRAGMAQLVDRWKDASLNARRKLDEVRQDGGQWQESKGAADQAWAELKALVGSAKAAY